MRRALPRQLRFQRPHPAPAKMVVEHLNLFYGDFQGLRDINLTFPENQVTALIGPSGCGKSTLLKTLNRMNDLVEGCRVEGSVLLDGADAYRTLDPTVLRRRVGMVFQQPNPFPMSIYDNVAFGPRSHGVRAKADLDIIVEESLRAAPPGRAERSPEKETRSACPAASSAPVHRSRPGRAARGTAARRVHERFGSHFHGED